MMDLTGVVFNTSDPIAVGLLVLVATASLYGVKVAIGMAKRA